MIDYNGTISGNYREGRALSHETTEIWRAAVTPFIETSRQPVILDVGAGTGRFAGLFAERFQAQVIAVDPSLDMLRAARADYSLKHVQCLAGKVESLPLIRKYFDMAWLSQVFHHIRDHRAAARELHRVLRPGGHVLIRGTFSDRLDGFPALFRFFPTTRLVCEDLPTTGKAGTIFEAEGFKLETDRRIMQRTCDSLREFAVRTRLRADTALILISDDEFSEGLASLDEAVAREPGPCPVMETLDLLVFRAVA